MDLRSSLEIIIRPVDIDLLEHCGDSDVSLNQAHTSRRTAPAPILSLASTIGLSRGRSQASAPPSDSRRVASRDYINERALRVKRRETHRCSLARPAGSSRGHPRMRTGCPAGCPALPEVWARVFVSWSRVPPSR